MNMKIEESIYPFFPEAERLPFYLTGIGGSEYQSHIKRDEGYQWHQLLFSAEGEGVLKADGQSFEIKKGSCFFLRKGTPHEYYPHGEKWEVRWISFDGYCCEWVIDDLSLGQASVVTLPESSAAEDIFDKMLISQREDILYCGYSCSGLVYDMLIEFHRHMSADVTSSRSRKLSTILPALKFMHDHFSEDFSLSSLSAVIGVTPQHFCRLFREALSMRPTDYLLKLRLDEAKRLIREGDLQMSQIALRCGFNDASYFSTVFKKHEGLSPAEWQRGSGATAKPTK